MGYDPMLPQHLTSNFGQGEFKTAKAQYLRRYFQPLAVDEMGMCEVCQKLTDTGDKK